jgi:non-specific serine/threonine protein kinase
LKFHIHYGVQRELSSTHFEEFDIILTTYGVVRNDVEDLNGFLWQYVILDESQAIKNPDARVTKAVQQLRAVNRVILSGTPVQNNTSDLYAQFQFLNPGLLGNREYFNREFGIPIDKLGSKEKTRDLKKLIFPFTLRRTKEQVAKDLPDKTVSVLWCTMEAEQRKLYNHYRDGYRNRLLKKIDEEGIAKSGIDVLEGLLRLRQLCDHPALVEKKEGVDQPSVKIEELTREVQENAGNHKLLVFSQFTQMLRLIEAEFIKAGISYCYLDGSTTLPQRKEQVNKFQEDETIKAFLISLKAGGVGLNLTVADYVYIVDPWWNPAAEQQAIDRAHRIGQTRKVFAYKMICKDSVEEKILQLQEKKKILADDLIQEDTGFVKNLSREDIEFLFG